MQRHPVAGLALLALAAAVGSSLAGPSWPTAEESNLSKLAWLTGSWRTGGGGSFVEEHWTSATGGMMVGMSRTTKGGKAVFFEFLRVEEGTEGIVYVAQPAGRPPTKFVATKLTDGEVVFENAAHDFPRRVIYRRVSENEVHARVDDGSDTGKHEEFKYKRFQLAESRPSKP